jgi:hypothetical protein
VSNSLGDQNGNANSLRAKRTALVDDAAGRWLAPNFNTVAIRQPVAGGVPPGEEPSAGVNLRERPDKRGRAPWHAAAI